MLMGADLSSSIGLLSIVQKLVTMKTVLQLNGRTGRDRSSEALVNLRVHSGGLTSS